MNKINTQIFNLAVPYLKKAVMKDFVLHTKGVIKSMELLLKKEKGDPEILIPCAILHDTGFSKVPKTMQKSKDRSKKIRGMELHLEYAPEVIREILTQVDFDKKKIKRICDIVVAHKFKKPRDHEKRLLIDADNLSDVFKEQFYKDSQAYKQKPKWLLAYRVEHNRFYTKTAQEMFDKEVKKRKKEIE
ncbi:HD domain-containing protein [Candidatus Kuenenbacteria bacterium]|nr:HD domain-containing protein [Candidatus Kuenenbacteria bacterium]